MKNLVLTFAPAKVALYFQGGQTLSTWSILSTTQVLIRASFFMAFSYDPPLSFHLYQKNRTDSHIPGGVRKQE